MRGLRGVLVGLICALALVACPTDPTPTLCPGLPDRSPDIGLRPGHARGRGARHSEGWRSGRGRVRDRAVRRPGADRDRQLRGPGPLRFYDGITFHRVIAGFVIQAGDPQTKENRGDFANVGKGGPGYEFEIEPPAEGLRYDPYVVAMANNRQTNGSQFFIDLDDLDQALRSVGVYTIFGKVIEGTDVVDSVAAVPVNDPQLGLPLTPVIIESITISAAVTPSGSPGE